MIEALTGIPEFHLSDFINSVFEPDGRFEPLAWFSGLFCSDLMDMETIGAAYQAYGPEAFNGVQTIGSCAALQDQYHVDIKYLGKVFTYQGQSIQIVGSVPHGTPGPMAYSFVKVSLLHV